MEVHIEALSAAFNSTHQDMPERQHTCSFDFCCTAQPSPHRTHAACEHLTQ